MDTISKRNKRKMQRLFTSCSCIWNSCDTTKVVSNGEEEEEPPLQLQKPSKIGGSMYDIRPPTPPRKRPQINDNETVTSSVTAPAPAPVPAIALSVPSSGESAVGSS
jgi:hypothetical protein